MHETRPAPSLSPETASQAAAGVLLVGIALAELWLAFWAAGWWHRLSALAVAAAGLLLLLRAATAVGLVPGARAVRLPRRRATARPAAASPVVLARYAR